MRIKDLYHYQTDVLVIGGGGGGAMAAYEASKNGSSVLMVLKGQPQHCGSTIMAPGAIAGVGDWRLEGDSQEAHFRDTIKGGAYLADQGLVRIMVEDAPELIVELERVGALWQRKENGRTYSMRAGGGHTIDRSVYLEDRTGREMLRALTGELRRRRVRILPDTMILKLLKNGDRVVGAAGVRLDGCEGVILRAKEVILACGGSGNLYANTDNPTDITGDGYALALDAGAALMDMEFVQFFPLGFCFPHSLKGALAALPYYIRLYNNRQERFMEKHDPERLELSTRDRVTRAIMKEINEGRGGPHGGVFAKMTHHEPGYIARMQPALYETYRKIGVDPEKDPLEVAPTCHFFMGGGKVDAQWQSTVPGLFLIGENAAGIHGANRLSQNALAELLVSGKRAGRQAAFLARAERHGGIDPEKAQSALDPVKSLFERSVGVRPHDLRKRLRQLMWDKVGVYRNKSGLQEALRELASLKEELKTQCITLDSVRYNRELIEALENAFLIATGICVAVAALERCETRGAHFREDHPKPDNRMWLRHLVIKRTSVGLDIQKRAVDLTEMHPEVIDG
jgi:succinate dehydrogenase/fumarate reductase flavoprotein subunit